MSTTKLDAEGLARKAHPDWGVYGLNGYAAAIREHSQPLSDELAAVKAERYSGGSAPCFSLRYLGQWPVG